MGMEFFILGIPRSKPRIYRFGELARKLVVIYSDAEWTVLDKEQWLNKGLGGILWEPIKPLVAAALDCPQQLVDALGLRKTQIILLELMAASGIIFTYGELFVDKT